MTTLQKVIYLASRFNFHPQRIQQKVINLVETTIKCSQQCHADLFMLKSLGAHDKNYHFFTVTSDYGFIQCFLCDFLCYHLREADADKTDPANV